MVLPGHADRPPALVELFSTVLRKDADGRTYLVTPVEKVGIRVVDAPFIAVEMDAAGRGDDQVLTFRTNVGDVVEAGPGHPLRFADEPRHRRPEALSAGPRPAGSLAGAAGDL